MTAFLVNIFVKNAHQTEDPAVRAAIGKLAGFTGIVCNLLLFLGKLSIGLLAGAVSIIADAANNLSDASSSIVTLLAFRISQKPADEDHPYGHARYEYLAGLAVAILILSIGSQIAIRSVEKICEPTAVSLSPIGFAVIAASILMKLWMSLFYRTLGKRIRSLTLKATAIDCRNDVIASSAVLLGCVIERIFSVRIDSYIGLAVAAFILYSGGKLLRETVTPLLGTKADKDLIERLCQLILSHEQILGCHDLLIHDYGPGQCFASVHAELSSDCDPMTCHNILDAIERAAWDDMNVRLVIHYDPVDVKDVARREMKQTVEEIAQGFDPPLTVHDFRITHDGDRIKLLFDLDVPYALRHRHEEFKIGIDQALAARGIVCDTVICFDEKA